MKCAVTISILLVILSNDMAINFPVFGPLMEQTCVCLNLDGYNALVKMSASWLRDEMCSNNINSSCNFYQMTWQSIFICLVLS